MREGEEYYTVGSPDSPMFFSLRIRPDYPKTYCYKIDDTRIVCGYGPVNPDDNDEFLQILITSNGSVTVRRDAYATLPLWLGESEGVVSLCNEHAVVSGDLPSLRLNRQGVLDTLVPHFAQTSTVWSEMQLLGERQILEIHPRDTVIHHPKPREWRFSAEAPVSEFRDFSRYFSYHLDRFTESRLKGQQFAYEVSGGLDSSLLPLYHVRKGDDLGRGMASLIFPGEFEITQRSKLDTIARLTGLPRYGIPLHDEANYPLVDLLEDKTGHPAYCLENIYAVPTKRLLKLLANDGVRVIVTGHGGDDVFENTLSVEEALGFGNSEKERRRTLQYAPFFTAKFRQDHLDAVLEHQPYPVPYLSASLLDGFVGLNNAYIEHDIWPVSPFIDPVLHEYCQGLPAHWRAKKAIMRIFYHAYGLPDEIFDPVQNEHFGGFFEHALTSGRYDNLIESLLKDSVASKLGYVNPEILRQAYQDNKQYPALRRDDHLLALYLWLSFEINAQKGLGSSTPK